MASLMLRATTVRRACCAVYGTLARPLVPHYRTTSSQHARLCTTESTQEHSRYPAQYSPTEAAADDNLLGDSVVQIQVLVRHGDRTALFNPHNGNKETQHKETSRMAEHAASSDDVAHLNDRFRVVAERGESLPPLKDEQEYPLGALTRIGLDQAFSAGAFVGERYREVVADVAAHELHARCSNFRRTAMTAQSFLAGVAAAANEALPAVDVVVEHKPTGVIGAYDSEIGLQEAAAAAYTSDPKFKEAEQDSVKRQAKAAFIKHVPHFEDDSFLWIHAADYFMTNRAHGVAIPKELEQFEEVTLTHCLWRFTNLFTPHSIRSLAAAGLLMDVLYNMEACVARHRGQHRGSSSISRQPTAVRMALFAGHDVTLLPVLYALTDETPTEWPGYAATLVFELHRLQPHVGHQDDDDDSAWAVAVRCEDRLLALRHPRDFVGAALEAEMDALFSDSDSDSDSDSEGDSIRGGSAVEAMVAAQSDDVAELEAGQVLTLSEFRELVQYWRDVAEQASKEVKAADATSVDGSAVVESATASGGKPRYQ